MNNFQKYFFLTVAFLNFTLPLQACGQSRQFTSETKISKAGEEPDSQREGDDEEAVGGSGAEMAVTEIDAENGLRFSKLAIEILGIQLTPAPSQRLSVPLSSLVYHQNEVGIYRVRNGWFKLVDVSLQEKMDQEAGLELSDWRPGDQIVIRGAALVRVAELDAFSEGASEED